MREEWLQSKTKGKKRFIWREMLWSLPLWLGIVVVVPALEAYRDHSDFSVRSTAFIALIMLPIFLLGAYLTAGWKWKDLEKKYPEDGLPPWQV
jgi:hypothetical protein